LTAQSPRRRAAYRDASRLRSRRCDLEPLTVPLAIEILAGRFDCVRPAEGCPQPGSAAAASLVLADKPGEVWLVKLAGRTIGDCGTHGPVDASGTIEIGYGFAAPYRGRGYGTEVVSVLTQWLVQRPGVARILARTSIDNVASWKLLEKVGFRRLDTSATALEYEYVIQRGD
jgi:GNAT superfamily N-acetyltransferase